MSAATFAGPKLRIANAAKVYNTRSGDLLAIDRCSLDIRAGEIISIVGPSGCGKTTLLWSMSGLHRLTAGDVLLDDRPVRGPNRQIGLVFQEANLLPWRDVDANINFPFEIRGEKADRVWIDELLNRVGLEGFGGRFPRELSGGMQQRAALVRALSFKPSVLLMDEPFGALDAFTREEMNRLVEEIWLRALGREIDRERPVASGLPVLSRRGSAARRSALVPCLTTLEQRLVDVVALHLRELRERAGELRAIRQRGFDQQLARVLAAEVRERRRRRGRRLAIAGLQDLAERRDRLGRRRSRRSR